MLNIQVDYYDSDEKKALEDTPFATNFSSIVSENLEIDPMVLIANSIFCEQKDFDGWRTRDELALKASGRQAEFFEYFLMEGPNFTSRFGPNDIKTSLIETAGVGLSISAFDKILNTHSADWAIIDITQEKDLDFRIAATDDYIVLIECKGSVIENPQYKKPTISNHKASIKAKKAVQREKHGEKTYLFGTIASISHDPNHETRVWLVDPPIEELEISPKELKTIKRLTYYYNLIRMLGSPHILISLSTRLSAMNQRMNDISFFDKLPLVNHRGEIFTTPSSFMSNRTMTANRSVAGIIRRLTDNTSLFLGVDNKIFDVIANQSHDDINSWESEIHGCIDTDLIVGMPDKDFDNYSLGDSIENVKLTILKSGFAIALLESV